MPLRIYAEQLSDTPLRPAAQASALAVSHSPLGPDIWGLSSYVNPCGARRYRRGDAAHWSNAAGIAHPSGTERSLKAYAQ
jgi:hypothetical protein